jgi:hypothetical protein
MYMIYCLIYFVKLDVKGQRSFDRLRMTNGCGKDRESVEITSGAVLGAAFLSHVTCPLSHVTCGYDKIKKWIIVLRKEE